MRAMRKFLAPLLALFLLMLAACAHAPGAKVDMMAEYANSVRWSDWDMAWRYVDPATRTSLVLPGDEQDRLHDVKVTGYTVRTSEPQPDGTIAQTVEIHFVDQATQVERTIRAHEIWRTDDGGDHWWLTTGLPEF